jgi:hypothetical protein
MKIASAEKTTEKKEMTISSDPVTAQSHIPQSTITRQQDYEKPTLSNVSNSHANTIIQD